MTEEKRQAKLAEELNKKLDSIFEQLYQIRDIIDNEEEGYGLIQELQHIRRVVERTIDNSIA